MDQETFLLFWLILQGLSLVHLGMSLGVIQELASCVAWSFPCLPSGLFGPIPDIRECISEFAHCRDQTPNKKQLKKRGVYSISQFEGIQSVVTRKAWYQEPEVAVIPLMLPGSRDQTGSRDKHPKPQSSKAIFSDIFPPTSLRLLGSQTFQHGTTNQGGQVFKRRSLWEPFHIQSARTGSTHSRDGLLQFFPVATEL